MSRFAKVAVALVFALPLAAYVAGTLMATDPAPVDHQPIILEQVADSPSAEPTKPPRQKPTRTPDPQPRPTSAPSGSADDDDDEPEVINPRPVERDDDDWDDDDDDDDRDHDDDD